MSLTITAEHLADIAGRTPRSCQTWSNGSIVSAHITRSTYPKSTATSWRRRATRPITSRRSASSRSEAPRFQEGFGIVPINLNIESVRR